MKPSQAAIDLITEFEGIRLKLYVDASGHPSIGYGHKMKLTESMISRITKEQATALLNQDVTIAAACVNKLKLRLGQSQFDALVSLAYNIGCRALKESTLIERVRVGHYKDAADQFNRWIYAKGLPLEGLRRRRRKEKELFEKDMRSPTDR